MRRALAPLLFQDEQLRQDRMHRDAVAPADSLAEAKSKEANQMEGAQVPVQSIETLRRELATRCRNTCRIAGDPNTAPPVNPMNYGHKHSNRSAGLLFS